MLRFVPSPRTFTVEEIPAYEPSGTGTHLFLWVEKRGLTTMDAIARVAAALEVPERDVGYAGLKDRHAVTRQWLSVADVDPARALALPSLVETGEGDFSSWAILRAVLHPHKLRLGHLQGNRFQVVLDGPPDPDQLANDLASLPAVVDRLAVQGLPNRFGAQRFGARGDNAAVGLELLRGTRRERDRRRRRLLLSAAQSAVFNGTLELRATAGSLTRVLGGDVLQKVDTGGLFVTTDPTVDQPRVDAGQVVPTGPLPGGREVEPPPGSEARAVEDAAIAALGATREDFARAGRELPGDRRPFVVHPRDLRWDAEDTGVRLSFALPAGVYATVLVDAILTTTP